MTVTTIPSAGITDATIATADIADDAVTAAKATGFGKIGQVKQTVKKDTFTTNSSSFTLITGLSVSITPTATSSKILIKTFINFGGDNNTYGHCRLLRGSTSILVGDAGEANQERSAFALQTDNSTAAIYKVHFGGIEFLDEPITTSALDYSIHLITYSSDNIYINRPQNNENIDRTGRYTSTITAMEVLA